MDKWINTRVGYKHEQIVCHQMGWQNMWTDDAREVRPCLQPSQGHEVLQQLGCLLVDAATANVLSF